MDTDLYKLRRFALAIGLILFLYAIAGVRLADSFTIHPLGIPLVIARPRVFEWGLVIASIYTAVRYWYYGFITATSPRRMREIIKHRKYPLVKDSSQAADMMRQHFPGVEDFNLSTNVPGQATIVFDCAKLPSRTKLSCAYRDIDYSAPIWVNALAIATLIVARTLNG